MSIPSTETVTVRIPEPVEPTRAAVAIVGEPYSLGMADLDVPGYTPTTWEYETYEEAREAADLWNERAGVSPERASQIVLSSMRGRVSR